MTSLDIFNKKPDRASLETLLKEHPDQFDNHEEFQTITIGEGSFTIGASIVIHGDEDVGWYVREWFKEHGEAYLADKDVQVKFVFSNPRAFALDQRSYNRNLNRMGEEADPAGSYEQRQMHRILDELKDVDVHIDFHSTTEPIEPHAFYRMHADISLGRETHNLAAATGLKKAFVYRSGFSGSPVFNVMDKPSVLVEVGAHKDVQTFERGVKVLQSIIENYKPNAPLMSNQQECYVIDGSIPYQEGFTAEPTVKDFEWVQKGQVLARGPNDQVISASDTFYPVHVDHNNPAHNEPNEKGILFMLKGHRTKLNPVTMQYTKLPSPSF